MLLRHLLSVLLLPFMVVVVVPWTLLHGPADAAGLGGDSTWAWLRTGAGVAAPSRPGTRRETWLPSAPTVTSATR